MNSGPSSHPKNTPPTESMALPAHISFRDGAEHDLDAVIEFLGPFVESQHLLPRTFDEYRVLLKHGFLAFSGSEIVGFAAVEIYSRKLAEIQALAVSPSQQRQGIGHRLVQMCVERARRECVVELMAITASEILFSDVGFHYTLPNLKRALFVNP